MSIEALLRGNRTEVESATVQKPNENEKLQLSVSVEESASDEFDDPALMEFKQDVSRLLQNDDIFADDGEDHLFLTSFPSFLPIRYYIAYNNLPH